jgi:hypothetical protein
MIGPRLRKARRLLDVQRGLQRLEEARIAALQGRKAELSALQEELLGALNAEGGPSGLLVDAIVRRLKHLDQEAAGLGEELKRRAAALQEQAGRAKFAERRSRDYEQQHARALADKELLEVIERLIGSEDASLP